MIGSSCICRDYDEAHPEFVREKVVKARKAHRCCECGEEISIGERHESVAGMWDGYFSAFRTCLPCKNVRDSLMKCGFVYGMLWEDVRDWFHEEGIETEDEDTDESWLL